jgi:hypothetical protein
MNHDPILAIALRAARLLRLPLADRGVLAAALKALGYSNVAIGEQLGVSEPTVRRDLARPTRSPADYTRPSVNGGGHA